MDAAWAGERWPEATLASLADGRDLYVSKCSGCHHLRTPHEVLARDRNGLMIEMGERAHLDDGQRELILRYLLAVTQTDPGHLADRDLSAAATVSD